MTVRDRLEKLRQHQNARKSGLTTPEPSAPRAERSAALQQPIKVQIEQPSKSSPLHSSSAISPATLLANAGIMRKPTPHVPVFLPEQQTDYWSIMAKQAAVESEQIKGIERAAHLESVKAVRSTLDEQIALKAKQKAEEKARALELRKEQEAAKAKWNAELRQKAEDMRLAAARIKEDRELQVKQLEEKREKQRLQHLKEEEEMRVAAELQLVEAKRLAEKEKERQRNIMTTLIAANAAQRSEVEERKQKERDLDKYYDEQAALKAEKDERARALALQQLLDKMKASDAIAAVNLDIEQERAAAEEARIRQYEALRIAREDRAKAAEEAKHARVLQKVKEIQAIQRQTKLAQLSDLEQQKKAEADELARILEEEKRAAEDVKRRAREKKFQQKALLEEQLRENENYHLVVVSDIERTLNKRSIDKALFLQNNGALSAEQLRRSSPF
jgi:hypothetical protein